MKRLPAAFLILLLFLSACGKKVPDDVIQPQAMEDLLYDYHLANIMRLDLPYEKNYQKDAYMTYVYKKHGVTEAQFDSSMVWYTRHTKELKEIYANLAKRYEQNETLLKRAMTQRKQQLSVSMSGDSLDIWQDRSLYLLTHSVLTDKLQFDLKTDTTFREKDALQFKANFTYLGEQGRPFRAVMGLKIQFENDSVVGMTRIVNYAGEQELYLRPDSAYKFRSVSGFIYYLPENRFTTNKLLVSDISLHRYHHREQPAAPAEPVKSDSVAAASAPDSLVKDTTKKADLREIRRQQRESRREARDNEISVK